jgi:hypothetical protein
VTPAVDPVEATRSMVALPRPINDRLSLRLGARPRFQVADLEEALYEARSLVGSTG